MLKDKQASVTTIRLTQCSFLIQNQHQMHDKDSFVLNGVGWREQKYLSNMFCRNLQTGDVIFQVNIPDGYSSILPIVWHRFGLLYALANSYHVFRCLQACMHLVELKYKNHSNINLFQRALVMSGSSENPSGLQTQTSSDQKVFKSQH